MTVWILTDRRYLGQRMPLALAAALEELDLATRVLVADDIVAEVAGDEDPWERLADGDAVLARTRDPFALTLLAEAARPGVSVLTPAAPIALVRNKARAARVLAAHGLPAPRTFLARDPQALRSLPSSRFPLLLKPHLGDNAEGIVLARDPSALLGLAWSGGMVLAQELVDAGGVDLKLYVAGERVWGIRRPSALSLIGGNGAASGLQAEGEPAVLAPALERMARRCAALFGLTLAGIDVLESSRGPLIVDVNEFPNYTGVAEAPGVLAGMVREALPAPARA